MADNKPTMEMTTTEPMGSGWPSGRVMLSMLECIEDWTATADDAETVKAAAMAESKQKMKGL